MKGSNNNTKAHELAQKQKEISIAEFFEKNRHLLGFDNKRKALLTTIKEAIDNSLDACEESKILPELIVEIIQMSDNRFRIIIEDNGPGIIEEQIPKIFAKLLYGSKFHKISQSRGQQGIGISASVMYSQLTTGRATKITSKIDPKEPAYYYELMIDTKTNKPDIRTKKEKEWSSKEHGTRIELDIEAAYMKGKQSVDEYLKETAICNPHMTLIYTNPKAEQIIFPRAIEKAIPIPKEIKPHPYGVELGRFIKMLEYTKQKTVLGFLTNEFSRVSSNVAKEICENARVMPNLKTKKVNREQAEHLIKGIEQTKIMSPPTDCLSPLGEEQILKGLKKEINAEYFCAVSRKPSVYRGNPFIIECGIAYGGSIQQEGTVNLMRFANRVPLLYQQGGCGFTKAVQETSWRSYGLSQSGSNIPTGPAIIMLHIASVWVPFTSEAKEALAQYPDILKEIKLAIQECGRKLMKYTSKKKRVSDELKKRSYIQKYIPHLANGLKELLELPKAEEKSLIEHLKNILEKKRGQIEKVDFDPQKNKEYDEDFAKIGKADKNEEVEQNE